MLAPVIKFDACYRSVASRRNLSGFSSYNYLLRVTAVFREGLPAKENDEVPFSQASDADRSRERPVGAYSLAHEILEPEG